MNARALHYVFKIGDRRKTIEFYKNVLKMKVLRHEEFSQGCEATCNGPYNGKWSKTMIGYGPESDFFVVELTYNYEISEYKRGNDFNGITIQHPEVYKNIVSGAWPIVSKNDEMLRIDAPGGFPFYIKNVSFNKDPITNVSIMCTDIDKSVEFWSEKCSMIVINKTSEKAVLNYGVDQCQLVLCKTNEAIDRAKAYGRIAFACPTNQLPILQEKMKTCGEKILTPLLRLPTPGKATVEVLILADPNDHEICFVGDEAFRELSMVDPNADADLSKAIEADKSDEWFSKRGGKVMGN